MSHIAGRGPFLPPLGSNNPFAPANLDKQKEAESRPPLASNNPFHPDNLQQEKPTQRPTAQDNVRRQQIMQALKQTSIEELSREMEKDEVDPDKIKKMLNSGAIDHDTKLPHDNNGLTAAIFIGAPEIVGKMLNKIESPKDLKLLVDTLPSVIEHPPSKEAPQILEKMLDKILEKASLQDSQEIFLGALSAAVAQPDSKAKTEVLNTLLAYGESKMDLTGKDGNGKTPLMRAAHTGETKVVEMLLYYGKVKDGMDECGPHGQTALHMAMTNGHIGIAKLLSGEGANNNIKDQQGHTPVQMMLETLQMQQMQIQQMQQMQQMQMQQMQYGMQGMSSYGMPGMPPYGMPGMPGMPSYGMPSYGMPSYGMPSYGIQPYGMPSP